MTVRIVLEEEFFTNNDSRDRSPKGLGASLISQISAIAEQHGGDVAHKRREIPSASGTFPVGEIIELTTYTFVSVAALAAFLRTVVGLCKDWIELTENKVRRGISVKVGEREVLVKPGDDILKIVQQHLSDEGNSNSL